LSRLAAEAEALVGISTTTSTHHHDLSDAVLSCYEQNVTKLKVVLNESNPFTMEDDALVNIITKAGMSDDVKQAVTKRDTIGEEGATEDMENSKTRSEEKGHLIGSS
jgi:hypothetical protein